MSHETSTLRPAGSRDSHEVRIPPLDLPGTLHIPRDPFGLVVFAHGSGSSRLSPRNVAVADALNRRGLATLLFDLLSPREEDANNRAKVFDIPLLGERLIDAIRWVDRSSPLKGARIGLFGASTGAAAALVAAAQLGSGSRPWSRAGDGRTSPETSLAATHAPTLLIVGGEDHGVIELNQAAYAQLAGPKELVIVPGATHLFSEPGTLEQVIAQAAAWFERDPPAAAAG